MIVERVAPARHRAGVDAPVWVGPGGLVTAWGPDTPQVELTQPLGRLMDPDAARQLAAALLSAADVADGTLVL